MKYYIASGLDNTAQVRELKAVLDGWGWAHTYDWTAHGSVQGQAKSVKEDVARGEVNGVLAADVVVVLLPGGRGTHVELGIALGNVAKIYLYSPNPEDFDGLKTCVFYHDAGVDLCYSWLELNEKLTHENRSI